MDEYQGPTNTAFLVFVVLIVCLALYYFYRWLNGTGDLKDVLIYPNYDRGMVAMTTKPAMFSAVEMPPLYGGGEFSISTWIYINNWGVNKGKNKVFLRVSGGGASGGFATMVMYLGQNINKLGVRVSYDSTDGIGTPNILDTSQMALITSGSTPYTDVDGDFKKCDIQTVDLQRWVNITAVLSGRTIDIYMDGKLSRSCVLDGVFKVDSDQPVLELGGPNGFGGYIGQTRGANFAYSPDQVYRNYLNGPADESVWSTLMRSLGQYSFNVKRNGQSVVDGSLVF